MTKDVKQSRHRMMFQQLPVCEAGTPDRRPLDERWDAARIARVKAEYINPLIRVTTEVLEAELGERVTRGNPVLVTDPVTGLEVCTVTAFSGKPHGLVIFGISSEHLDWLVERMLYVPKDDVEIAGFMLVELGQLIIDSAITYFPEDQALFTYTAPALFLNNEARLAIQRTPRISVPLSIADIALVLQVSLTN